MAKSETTKTELVRSRKYNEDGTRREVEWSICLFRSLKRSAGAEPHVRGRVGRPACSTSVKAKRAKRYLRVNHATFGNGQFSSFRDLLTVLEGGQEIPLLPST